MDPLLGFKFIVIWDGDPVAGVSKVGSLQAKTEKVGYGNDPAPVIPGQTTYEPVELERGLIIDVAFEQWANKVLFYENTGALGEAVSLRDFRKDVTIQVCNQAGQVMKQYLLFNCWPSEYTAMPDLDAGGNDVGLETMTLQNEGWQRDDSFVAPAPLDGYPSVGHPDPPGTS
jgi:phage tail-like protein